MNLNQKIQTILHGGIPGYNLKINEIIATVNWLMGMRSINGRAISESDHGPIFDLSQTNMTQPAATPNTAWAIDPDGNPGGWSLMTFLDLETKQSFDTWVWNGQDPTPIPDGGGALGPMAKNVQPIQWMVDPSGNDVDWVVCKDNTFWGSGACPLSTGNFVTAHIAGSATGANPYVYTCTVPVPPLAIPPAPPPMYLVAEAPPSGSQLDNAPCLKLITGVESADVNGLIITWTLTIIYDGTTVAAYSGSNKTFWDPSLKPVYLPLNPTGWQFDPGGLPGYAKGSGKWVFQYQGPVSESTNPVITQRFSWSVNIANRLASFMQWDTVYLTT